MTKLITQQPNRMFAFGCSFTGTSWANWADIIAQDLQIPYYNYGMGGAGNQYIFNVIMQADGYFNFNEDDLVIVSWTNVCREDRYVNNRWVSPGNIFTQEVYNQQYVRQWADPFGYAVRDFASIKATAELLKNRKSQYHFLKMIDFDFINQWNQQATLSQEPLDNYANLANLYQPYLSEIHRSFFEVLWNNDINIKFAQEKEEVGPFFADGHPSVAEHFKYLTTIFSHNFSTDTAEKVQIAHNATIAALKKFKSPIGAGVEDFLPNEALIATHLQQPRLGFC